jgi:hypothetical protein
MPLKYGVATDSGLVYEQMRAVMSRAKYNLDPKTRPISTARHRSLAIINISNRGNTFGALQRLVYESPRINTLFDLKFEWIPN